jgi:hypothetical protein
MYISDRSYRSNMINRLKYAIAASVLLLAGCVTGEKMARLDPGMTKNQVIETLGKPDGFESRGEYEALKYSNRLMSGFSWDRGDYFVILKEGKVVEYGVGTVREKTPNSNVLILVPTK